MLAKIPAKHIYIFEQIFLRCKLGPARAVDCTSTMYISVCRRFTYMFLTSICFATAPAVLVATCWNVKLFGGRKSGYQGNCDARLNSEMLLLRMPDNKATSRCRLPLKCILTWTGICPVRTVNDDFKSLKQPEEQRLGEEVFFRLPGTAQVSQARDGPFDLGGGTAHQFLLKGYIISHTQAC